MDLTEKNSFYSAASQMLGFLTIQGKMQEISSLKTEAEYFNFIWNIPKLHSLLQIEPMPSTKSDNEALKAKEEGNLRYKDRDLIGALQMYSRGMMYASCIIESKESVNLLAICAANRSAVLYQQGRYKQAVVDIQFSLDAGYPRELVYKLYERKARCLIGCKQLREAITYFTMATEKLAVANLEEKKRKKLSDLFHQEIEKCEHRLSGKEENNNSLHEKNNDVATITRERITLPSVTGVQNINIPSASALVGLSFSPAVGRYGVAKNKINIGDVLIADTPFAAVLNLDSLATNCFHCFCRIDIPYPCRTCTSAVFCSPNCSQTAYDSYHNTECGYIKYFQNSGAGTIAALAFRLAVITGYDNMVSSSTVQTCSDEFLTKNINYNSICCLVTNMNCRQPKEMIQYAMLAAFVVKALCSVQGWFPSEDVNTIGALVLRNLFSISCNGIEITEYIVKSKELNSLGLGLFPVVSLLNHSCDPSCELVFYGNSCALYSLKEMQTGDEISIDYGFVYYLSNKFTRQEALQSQYQFNCSCVACENDWPTKSKIPNQTISLMCSKCNSVLPIKITNKNSCIHCPKCSKVTDYDKTWKVLKMAEAKPKQSLNDHVRFVQLLQRLVAQPNRMYATALWEMRKVFQTIGNSNG